MKATDIALQAEPITITVGTSVEVTASNGPDWFAVHIRSGGSVFHTTTVYLRRAQLRALKDRLIQIDVLMPEPGAEEQHERD